MRHRYPSEDVARFDSQFASDPPDDERIEAKYHELLYAVERKFPGETRHQTALRYIKEAEARAKEPGQVQAGL